MTQTKTLTVTPDEFLANGDTVDIHVTGAAPNELLFIFQCNRPDPPEKTDPAPNALNHCAFTPATFKTANANASGVLDTTFTVTQGTVTSLGNEVTFGDTAHVFVTNATETFADAPPHVEISFGDPPGPTATATPSSDLDDGEIVTLAWSGFPASQPIAATQCTGTVDPTDAGQCDLASFVQSTSDANGAGSMSFTVRTGPIGEGGGTCDAANQCVILVADFGGVGRAVTVLSFAAAQGPTTTSTTATTGSTSTTVAGSSTTATTRATTPTTTAAALARTGRTTVPATVAALLLVVAGTSITIAARGRAIRLSSRHGR